jgi:hypothetical protein
MAQQYHPTKHRYAVAYKATAWVTVYVEAEDEAEASDLADAEFSPPSLCYHCSSKIDLSDFEAEQGEYGITDEGPVGDAS